MNYLAHFYFARQDAGLITGAFLGDYLKGSLNNETNKSLLLNANLPESTTDGIRLHRHIDAQFDQLELLDCFKRECPEGTRRYAGIFLDLYCDHLLCSRWREFSDKPVEIFEKEIVQTLRKSLCDVDSLIPGRAFLMINAFDQYQLLSNYYQKVVIERAIDRIGQRLKMSKLDNVLEPLWALTSEIDNNFDNLINQMQNKVDQYLKA